ncbi:hypothetical protein P9A16_32545 [Shinella sp. 838]|uniref:hypothetical protein n=1 Tax=Shinella sp. 838 TaxID=3038164 RepID=UPI002414E4DD|nr:hypothetical protein [Shinella sp. 838]MDG4675832.1 hypothetical protein [Shinella sp. 838]
MDAEKAQASPRAAGRALCSSRVLPENTKFEGQPMWESFLPEVDTVLKAVLAPEEWERMKAEGPEV